jgi:tetratricopeptide (TPR) repeat protein
LAKHDTLRNALSSRAILELGAVGKIVAGCLSSYGAERIAAFQIVLRQLRQLPELAKRQAEDSREISDQEDWLMKGISFQKLGEHEEALKCFNRDLIINPRDPQSYLRAAASWRALGDSSLAETLIAQALELDPNIEHDGSLIASLGEQDPIHSLQAPRRGPGR